MVKGLWNYAIKVADMEQAIAFYIDARRRGAQPQRGAGSALHAASAGRDARDPVREAPYEDLIGETLPCGFLHDVYEVDDFDEQIARLRAMGVRFIMEPRDIEADFGRRRIAFFETLDGMRTEVMQIFEDPAPALTLRAGAGVRARGPTPADRSAGPAGSAPAPARRPAPAPAGRALSPRPPLRSSDWPACRAPPGCAPPGAGRRAAPARRSPGAAAALGDQLGVRHRPDALAQRESRGVAHARLVVRRLEAEALPSSSSTARRCWTHRFGTSLSSTRWMRSSGSRTVISATLSGPIPCAPHQRRPSESRAAWTGEARRPLLDPRRMHDLPHRPPSPSTSASGRASSANASKKVRGPASGSSDAGKPAPPPWSRRRRRCAPACRRSRTPSRRAPDRASNSREKPDACCTV